MSLRAAVEDPLRRSEVAAAAITEARQAIADVGGVRGATLKLGFDTVERIRPGFLQKQIDDLLPGFADALEPHWQTGLSKGDPQAHLESNGVEVANDLLAVSDARAEASNDATARAAYAKVRSGAPKRIAEHMPRIASFVTAHQ